MEKKYALMDALSSRGSEFLGSRHPVICGAMTWVSDPGLVSAVSAAGGFGCLAGGNAPVEVLKAQIEETRRLTDRPFGVNLITISPAYHAQLEMLKGLERPVSHVVFAGGVPRDREVAEMKACGSRVMCFAPTLALGERLLRFGADALVLEGAEAGGHVGQVSTTVLVQQILFQLGERVPVFVAGGIGTGRLAAHLLLMGAAGVQLGTRFVMTRECSVHDRFKELLAHSAAHDAAVTAQFDARVPVSAVRAIRNQGTAEFGRLQLRLVRQVEEGTLSRQDAQLELERFWMGALRRAAVEGDVEQGSVMSGQSVGLFQRTQTVQEVMDGLLADGEAELARLQGLLGARASQNA